MLATLKSFYYIVIENNNGLLHKNGKLKHSYLSCYIWLKQDSYQKKISILLSENLLNNNLYKSI